jgi:hypothetical protein
LDQTDGTRTDGDIIIGRWFTYRDEDGLAQDQSRATALRPTERSHAIASSRLRRRDQVRSVLQRLIERCNRRMLTLVHGGSG